MIGRMAATLAIAAAALAVPGTAAAPSSCAFNVTSIIADSDSTVQQVPFQVRSDGQGAYVSYKTSQSNQVSSVIQSPSCDWVLDLSFTQARTVVLTLEPFSSPSAPPFTTANIVSPRIISKCELNPANNGLSYGLMTSAGQVIECGFHISFDYNANSYALRMNAQDIPTTNWARVTCTGAVSSKCNAWTVTPPTWGPVNPATGQTSAIGELIRSTTVKGKTLTTNLGLYYVAFSVTITK